MTLLKRVAFISGHLDITQDEFDEHYKKKIIDAHNDGHVFLVCDANGVDTKAQELLLTLNAFVCVYHMFDTPRNLVSDTFRRCFGFTSDEERDTFATTYSDYDIAWVRPGREKSGTAKNIKRRENMQ